MIRTHKDLDVWKKSIAFVTKIYSVSALFPKSEVYGLTSQIRGAAVSIPSNIAKRSIRNHTAEFKHLLFISLASAAELVSQ